MDSHSSSHYLPFQADHSSLSPSTSSPPLNLLLSHIFAILFCYFVGVFGLSVFFIAPIVILFWTHWRECYDTFVWVTRLRIEYLDMKKEAHRNGESVEWLNRVVEPWWSACEGTIAQFVQDWMEPIASKFKLDYVVEYLKILSFNTGPYRSKFSNLRILQKVSKPKSSKDDVNVFIPITLDNLLHPPIVSAIEGRCTFAIEVDVDLNVPRTEFKMQAKLGGFKQKLLMNIESFHMSGRVQCVLNVDRRAVFPHLSTADFCFLPTPKLKVNCRTLKDKLDVSTTPILKQIGEKYIEREFQRILVYPKKEHVDFTPTQPIGSEWSMLRESGGLSQGVLTVKIEPVTSRTDSDSIKKTSLGIQYMKLKLGSQKCRRQLFSDEWSSTFSFLVHDCNTEKLIAKLKSKRKMRHGNNVNTMNISLASLGIGTEDSGSTDKKVQMSTNGVQLLFSLSYTTLPLISLISPIASLQHCSMEDSGVLYVHVHGCQGIMSCTGRADYQPYCVVRNGPDIILRTHSLSGVVSNVSWEKGIELLIRSCRGLELTFEVFSDGGALGTHDSLGLTTLRLSMGQPQIIQNRLPLTCPLRKFSKLRPLITPNIYISVIYRNVESVNLTRDSLQEAFFERPRRHSLASCMDQTTKYLNPHTQGYTISNVRQYSDDNGNDDNDDDDDDDDSLSEGSYDISTIGSSSYDHTHNDYSNRIVSGLEDSLCMSLQPTHQ